LSSLFFLIVRPSWSMTSLYSTGSRQPVTGAAAPCSVPLGGDPLAPYSGCSPPLDGAGVPGPFGRGRRAPPRGVDVKQPLRKGPGRAQGARNTPKTPKSGFLAQNRYFGHFSRKTGFLALFRHFQLFPRGVFYINPSRRGPVPGILPVLRG